MLKKSLSLVKKQPIQLGLIVLLALVVRLYKIDNPVLDWHAWRQADTASVTREYVKQGVKLLEPQYHDLSNIPSGKVNLQGYRMVEFPLINGLVAVLLRTFPYLNLEITSRFVSILFSLGTLLSLYWLVKQTSQQKIALLAAFFFALIPYSVYYSRVILPEPAFICFYTFSLASFTKYLSSKQWQFWLISVTSLALAFLLKPFVAFFAPVYLSLIFLSKKNVRQLVQDKLLWLYPILAILPFIAWRRWIQNFAVGIPASDLLFNGSKIRLKPAWFRWLFYERVTKLILGFLGLILIPFNLVKKDRSFWILFSWGLGILIYFVVIATGNVRHDYYQALITPWISWLVGRGLYYCYQFLQTKTKYAKLFCVLIIVGQLIWSWQQVKGYYNVNHWEYLKAGQAVDSLLPKNAIVIAPAMGDTQFLYQTNRRGWPIGFEIETKIKHGATHYVTTSLDQEAKELKEKYSIVKETQDYLILDLRKTKDE